MKKRLKNLIKRIKIYLIKLSVFLAKNHHYNYSCQTNVIVLICGIKLHNIKISKKKVY